MKQLKYNTADNDIRIDFPEEWNIADLTGLTATIKDTDGVELLAVTAVTIYPSTTLDGATDRYSETLVLDSGATAPDKGDLLTLVGSGGTEVVKVKGYDPALFTVTLEEITENQYDDGDAVYGGFGNITVDTTDTDVFVLGKNVQILWTPAGTGTVTKELFDIARFSMDLVSLRARFQNLYPRAYKAFTVPTDRFSDMVVEAESEVKEQMASDLMVYDGLCGQEPVLITIMAQMAYMWTWNGDDEIEDEREFLKERYNTKYAVLKALPIWTDINQDDKKDENEISSHEHVFDRRW